MQYLRIRRGLVALVAVLLASLAAACGGGMNGGASSPPSGDAISVGVPAQRQIIAFGAAVPGTSEAVQELESAKTAGFTGLINYSSMNAASLDDMRQYLSEAQRLGVGVVLSLKDVLGDKDIDGDAANRALHRRLYGNTTDTVAEGMLRAFGSNPAVIGVLISDELPGSPEELGAWLPHLKERYGQAKKFAPNTPVMTVLYWSGQNDEFYSKVKDFADDLAVDYYPYPKNEQYGLESAIPTIGATLRRTAGDDGWFTLEAFGWGTTAHPEGENLGYTKEQYEPPKAADMVRMAKAAVEGGAHNLIFYSLADPNPADLAEVKSAVAQIRSATWWTS